MTYKVNGNYKHINSYDNDNLLKNKKFSLKKLFEGKEINNVRINNNLKNNKNAGRISADLNLYNKTITLNTGRKFQLRKKTISNNNLIYKKINRRSAYVNKIDKNDKNGSLLNDLNENEIFELNKNIVEDLNFLKIKKRLSKIKKSLKSKYLNNIEINKNDNEIIVLKKVNTKDEIDKDKKLDKENKSSFKSNLILKSTKKMKL